MIIRASDDEKNIPFGDPFQTVGQLLCVLFVECFLGALPHGIFRDFDAQRPPTWRPLGGHLEVCLGIL